MILETLAIANTIASFAGASAEANQREAEYAKNRIAAASARDLKIQSLNARMLQEGEAAAAQKQQLAIAALKKEERAKVAAGEAGVSGQGVDALVDQFETARLRGVTTVNAQTKALRNQIEMEKMGVTAEAINRINSFPRGQQPNFLTYALKGASQLYGIQSEKAFQADTASRLTALQASIPQIPSLPPVPAFSPFPQE